MRDALQQRDERQGNEMRAMWLIAGAAGVDGGRVDLVLSCVDNYGARMTINKVPASLSHMCTDGSSQIDLLCLPSMLYPV